MKPLRTKPGLMICLAVSALLSGCDHKKPQVATPTAEQAPQTVQPAPEPTPAETQPQTAAAPTQGTPPPAPEQPPDDKTEKPKPKNGKQHTAAKKNGQAVPGKSTQDETAHNIPPKIVVKSDGSAAGPTPGVISPGPARPDSPRDQATTEQLLQTVETNLNGIKRQLSSDEQAIVTQIRDYVNQSRQATKENDAVRAHNLALKAQLLSDDLARKR